MLAITKEHNAAIEDNIKRTEELNKSMDDINPLPKDQAAEPGSVNQ